MNFSDLRDEVSGLLSSRDRLSRTDFKFYWRGLLIDTIEQLDNCPNNGSQLKIYQSKHFQLVLSNYSKLPSELLYNRFVDYTLLNRHFNGQIDRGFFRRFTHIRRLVINEPIGDQEQFVWFVRNCKLLEEFKVKNSGLDPMVYDQLARLLSTHYKTPN